MQTTELKENIFLLDDALIPNEIKDQDYSKLNKSLTKEGRTLVRTVISGDIKHKNYLSYLETAWANHYGVIVSPDILWQIVLCEISSHIKSNSEKYRSLFTTNPSEKTNIIIPTDDAELIDLSVIIEELKNLVPTNTDLFLPKFSTTTESSQFALNAAFADAVSPYYNYMMYMCGISKIKVLGEVEDWNLIRNSLTELSTILNVDKNFGKYLFNLVEIIENIINSYNNQDISFWSDIFRLERCGSGHQTEVEGWITKFFNKTSSPGYVDNYPTCVSVVEYKNITTNVNYEIVSGLFSSKINNEFLIPDFGYVINKID